MKKAIITGASSGLGEALGKQLKDKGVEVINVSRKESEFLDIKCDLAVDKDIESMLNEIKEKHSDFDLLVLNAGIMPKAKVGDIEFDIDQTFKINVTSNMKILNSLMPELKSKPSDVVIVGSVCAFNTYVKEAVYAGTKFALNGFVKNLQLELRENNIRVIGVHPGGFNSNLRGPGVIKEGAMDPNDIARIIINSLELPRMVEVSEMIINRKKF